MCVNVTNWELWEWKNLKKPLGLKFYFLLKCSHCRDQKCDFPPLTRLLSKATFPYASCRWWWAFEDIVLGFCVNPLLGSSLAGCLLLLMQKNRLGSLGPLRISQHKFRSFNGKWEVYLQRSKLQLVYWSDLGNEGQENLIKSSGLWMENAVCLHLSLIFPSFVLMANKMHLNNNIWTMTFMRINSYLVRVIYRPLPL